MQEIAKKLELNAKQIRYGTAGVELSIHEGRVVKTIYRTQETEIEHQPNENKEDNDG